MATSAGAMLTVTFVEPGGERTRCVASAGDSVMLVALVNGIDGVLAECGGALSCGTCHVYVDEAHFESVSTPGADEEALLDMTAAERRPGSRLGCQIRLTDALDGLVVHLPDRQV